MGTLSLKEAAVLFAGIAVEMNHVKHQVLEEAAKIWQDEAKRVLGTYNYGWPQLKAATQRQREQQGYEPNAPLLRTGDLRDSIEREVHHNVAYVGSNNKKALWHEFGTSRIPPRPFIGGALVAKRDEIGELVRKKIHAALLKG